MDLTGLRTDLSRRLFLGGGMAAGASFLGRIAPARAAGMVESIEGRPLTAGDMGLAPPLLDLGGRPVPLDTAWNWGQYQTEPNAPPLSLMHSWSPKGGTKGFRVRQLAGELRAPSKILDVGETYAGPISMRELSGDSGLHDGVWYTHEVRGGGRDGFRYLYSPTRARLVDGKVAQLTWTYMPYALVFKLHDAFHTPYILQHCMIEGTVGGRKVSGWGGWDRLYGKSVQEALPPGQAYAGMVFAGVMPDGTREWGYVDVVDDHGQAYYCRDGHDPIVSHDVTFAANWHPSPVDKGSMIYTRASWSFEGKVINFEAKYGRGGDIVPKRTGFSQGSGIWWEGSTPRPMFPQFNTVENHNARTDARLPGAKI